MSEELRELLPRNAVWTVEDLAAYLDTNPVQLMQNLTKNGVKVLDLGSRFKLKLVRIEDLYPK
jgi:hypothetical protein